MPDLDIRIVGRNDTRPVSTFAPEVSLDAAVVLEAGMTSGRASVALLLTLPDGQQGRRANLARNHRRAGRCWPWGRTAMGILMWVRCPVQTVCLTGEPHGAFQCVLVVHHCGAHDYDQSPKPAPNLGVWR